MTRGYHKTKREKSTHRHHRAVAHGVGLPRLAHVNRRGLLASTALASTLLIAVMAAPTPAAALVTCVPDEGTGPNPITIQVTDDINCINTEARSNAGFATGSVIDLRSDGAGNYTYLNTSGTLTANYAGQAGAIVTRTGAGGGITIVNSGDMIVESPGGRAVGIYSFAPTAAGGSPIDITNSGDATVAGAQDGIGIGARVLGPASPMTIVNSGDLTVTAGAGFIGRGISALAEVTGDTIYDGHSTINIQNTGELTVTGGDHTYGVFGRTIFAYGTISIENSGHLLVEGDGEGYGIYGRTSGDNDAAVDVTNTGDITVTADQQAWGIYTESAGADSSIAITNRGDISATSGANAVGIGANATGPDSTVNLTNSGDVRAVSGANAVGIGAFSPGAIRIENSGAVFAQAPDFAIGVFANGGGETTIINSGAISSSTLFAINVIGAGTANIQNSGTITGYVSLTDQDDIFVNQSGGLFDAKMTSFFNDGDDLFTNAAGGTVRALNIGATGTRFEGLERFENRGTISMVDGAEGDSFTISNTPGGMDTTFNGSGRSTLAVDAFLGAPGSRSDTLTIEGNVSGRTEITVNNTNPGGGALNTAGIPIVFATGETPSAGGFFLDAPISAGFFDYDLFFVPTGSGRWELRSSLGAGAQVLPQLITASQDIWHQSSSVWFDRSADLRVLLARGNAPAADLGSKSLGAPAQADFTPAVWVRGSGARLNRDGSSTFTSFGRSTNVELDRDLETSDFQMGLDLGQRNLLSQGDILVFGMLGGFVHGDLDYEGPRNDFDFTGGQVGAYATYLKGGLFVDTLFNAHFYELDANGALGYPNNDLDASTLGLRTDAGYRFGSFSGGAFLEPLATIAVTWADIDGFSLGANSVNFDNDANVRGRLGLRAGTTVDVWDSTIMEPFVTGSLWGHLAGDNQATLVSGGNTFRLEDNFEDVWGEVSAGVNFFNFSETTSVFAKVDVTFGDDVSGVGGKAGMRVAW